MSNTENLILRESAVVPNRETQKTLAAQVVESVLAGEVDPLKLHVWIRAMKNVLDEITDNDAFRDAALAECKKYPAGDLVFGAKIEVRHRTNYKYDGDAVWQDLDAKKKAREKLLKAIPVGEEIADVETGLIARSAIAGGTEYIVADFKEARNGRS